MANSKAGWPAAQVGADMVSVSYARTKPGCFEWRVTLHTGEVWNGITPPTPSRYMNGATLDDALLAVLYCMLQCAQASPPIRNLMHFPYEVTRWAVDNHGAIRDALEDYTVFDVEQRHTPITLFVSK